MTAHVDVQLGCDDESIPAADEIGTWVNRAVDAARQNGDTEVSVRVVGRSEMQQLNKDFRGQDKATNVLSFPAGAVAGLPDDAGMPLGDLVVCAAVVSDEGQQQGKASADHWAHMLVHGTLHLLGFNHETDDEAAVMESLETQILADHGIANPYQEN